MRRELVFGIYLVLVAFSVLCMGLILLLLAKGEEGKRQRYQAARNFSLVVFGMILLYLAFYYQDTVAQISAVPLAWRLADYLLWAPLPGDVGGGGGRGPKVAESRGVDGPRDPGGGAAGGGLLPGTLL